MTVEKSENGLSWFSLDQQQHTSAPFVCRSHTCFMHPLVWRHIPQCVKYIRGDPSFFLHVHGRNWRADRRSANSTQTLTGSTNKPSVRQAGRLGGTRTQGFRGQLTHSSLLRSHRRGFDRAQQQCSVCSLVLSLLWSCKQQTWQTDWQKIIISMCFTSVNSRAALCI